MLCICIIDIATYVRFFVLERKLQHRHFSYQPQQKNKELTLKCSLKKNSCQEYSLCTQPGSQIPLKVFETAAAVEKAWLPYGLFGRNAESLREIYSSFSFLSMFKKI